MASTYADTALLDAVMTASEDSTFQAFETRGSEYGALDAAVAGMNKLLPKGTLQTLKQSDNQPLKIDVFNKEDEGAATTFSCDASGAGATARQSLVFQGFVESFSLSYGEMIENRYSYQEMFRLRWREKMKNLYKRMDSYIVSILEANFSAGAGTNFTLFNNAFQVPLDAYDIAENRAALWLNKVKADMFKNDFSGNFHILGESNLLAICSSMLNQGQGNETNLGWQFQGVSRNATNRIVNNTGIYATGFVFEVGAFGAFDWTPKIFRAGLQNGQDVWTSFVDPRYGMTWGVKSARKCADNTSINSGMAMGADWNESWQIGCMLSAPRAYDSDGNSFIYKYEFDNDNSVLSGSGSYV